MIEVKVGQNVKLPVRLFTASGTPVTGVTWDQVTFRFARADGATGVHGIDSDSWTEVTGDIFDGQGLYKLELTGTATGAPGPLVVAVKSPSSDVYMAFIKCVENEEVDTYTLVNDLPGYRVQFTAGGDTVSPVIARVSTQGQRSLRVDFSEPVVMSTASNGALNPSNYTLVGGTVSAVQQVTGLATSVLLTTSAMTPGITYTLRVENVEDLYGNPII